jgi:acetate---CoA ligase (ADP-forming) subunit alpha
VENRARGRRERPALKTRLVLEHFFNPSSIAIIGASPKKDSIGGLIVRNLLEQGYGGPVYPVNPKFRRTFGLTCYSDLSAIRRRIDLLVVAIPARFVPDEVAKAARLGIRRAIIVSAGFKEIGDSGRKLEDSVAKIANEGRVRFLGPNCLGIFDNVSKIDTFFVPRNMIERPPVGVVSLASQSGSFVGHVMDLAAFEKLGIARVVTYGNEADLDEKDALRYFADDSSTQVVGLYIESIKNGREFVKAARYCAGRKPLIVLKAGRAESISRATTSHTGSIAGRYSAYWSAFEAAGAVEVFSELEFVDACKALSMVPRSLGRKVLIVGHAGGLGLTLADLCITAGLQIPQVDDDLASSLREKTLPIASFNNPIDLTASGTDDQVAIVLDELFVRNKSFADVAIYLGVWGLIQTSDRISEIMFEAMKRSGKPVIVASIQGKRCIEKKHIFEEKGIPVFLSLERAAKAARHLCLR